MIFVILLPFVLGDFNEWYQSNSKYMTIYGVSKEESKRAYEENVKYIEDFNKGKHSYKMSIKGRWTGFPRSKLNKIFRPLRRDLKGDFKGDFKGCSSYHYKDDVPKVQNNIDYVDHRDKLSNIRDQGSCGGCYSFGSLGALEGRLNIKYNHKFDLSEQEVIDCSVPYGNAGCSGGIGEYVYSYIIDNKLSIENDYKYTAHYGTCNKNVTKHVVLKNYRCTYNENENKILNDLIDGPIDFAMNVQDSFLYYDSGFYEESRCISDINHLDHEMTIVGYGYNNNRLYYIIRNSWGSSWGMSGYAYVYSDQCGIEFDTEVPLDYELI